MFFKIYLGISEKTNLKGYAAVFYACFIILNFKCTMVNTESKYDLRSAVKFKKLFLNIRNKKIIK